MTDNQYYTYSDSDGDEINVQLSAGSAILMIGGSGVTIPRKRELPNLIAVLQSYIDEPEVNTEPWYVVEPRSDIIGPFATAQEARESCSTSTGCLVRQIKPPTPVIDYDDADTEAKRLLSDDDPDVTNLARAYLALSAKQ